MFLKYDCPHCGYEIITKYLKPGDNLTCKSCNSEITVPVNAIETDEGPTFFSKSKSKNPPDIDWEDDSEKIEQSEEIKLPTPWGIWSIVKFVGAYLGSIILFSCPAGFIAGFYVAISGISKKANPELFKSTSSKYAGNILEFVANFIAIGLIYYSVVKRHHHSSFFSALHLKKTTKSETMLYILIALGINALVITLIILLEYLGMGKLIPKNMPIDKEFKAGYGAMIWFSIMVLLAPIPEELICRGYLYEGFKNQLGIKWSAVIVTLIFVLLHGPQLSFSPIMLGFISMMAIAVIIIRIKTDSLTKCIIVHQIYNTSLIIILWTNTLIFGPPWMKT